MEINMQCHIDEGDIFLTQLVDRIYLPSFTKCHPRRRVRNAGLLMFRQAQHDKITISPAIAKMLQKFPLCVRDDIKEGKAQQLKSSVTLSASKGVNKWHFTILQAQHDTLVKRNTLQLPILSLLSYPVGVTCL